MKREISEIRPFEEQFEVFHLPSVRIIGKEARSGGTPWHWLTPVKNIEQ